MARTKFNTIRIEYAGADLVSGGMLADTEGALGVSMQYSTDAVPALGADYVALDNAGNAQGGTEVSVAVDYETEGAMLAGMLARKAFADGHQRGVLRYVVEGGGSNARAVVEPLAGFTAPSFGLAVRREGGEAVGSFNAGDIDGAAAFVAALNDLDNWGIGPGRPMETPLVSAELDEATGKVILEVADAAWAGEAGNALYIDAGAPGTELPFTDETPVEFSGGSDSTEYAFTAGLAGFEATSTLAGRWRMVYRYSFILGAAAGA